MLPGLAGGNLPKGAEREEDIKPWLTLGNKTNEADENIISGKWTGIKKINSFAIPEGTIFISDEPNDLSQSYGLRIELNIIKERIFHGKVILHTSQREAKSSYFTTTPVSTTAKFSIIGSGKLEIIDLPFTAFDKFYPFGETFRQIKKIEIRGNFADGKNGQIIMPLSLIHISEPTRPY